MVGLGTLQLATMEWLEFPGERNRNTGTERLQMSFSTCDMRSRVVWYESSVAHTVILSWMLPWPSS
ncbi:hypothetical protein EYF80_043488 [Liparis tanakae]|uniref:Uncharacterized protein n=1 Tax=Liparis tanakae TaxID=230148 RepID=A0A4Z2G1B9_9TELE|nr:hypothetical protein EYF80_043488 [Liparis tanakae]